MFHKFTILCSCLVAAATAESVADSAEIQTFENALAPAFQLQGREQLFNITDRLKHHNVPGVSVALIENGDVAWAKAWGVQDTTTGEPATRRTLFQAASISKPVAAFTALRMVDAGTLDLTAPINTALTRWQVADNDFTRQQPVTPEHILSHTAGMTVHGFPGYRLGSNYPTTIQILDGEAPANTSAIYVDTVPGTMWRYSGGGYTVLQLAMEDVTGLSFPALTDGMALKPLGMDDSSFQTPPPEKDWPNLAAGHKRDGAPVDGKFYVHPEMAAASLWTTPSDIAIFATAVIDAWHGKADALLPQGLAQDFLTVRRNNYGLGVGLQIDGGETIGFQHGGSNKGYRAFMIAFLNGQGAVVMTNSDNGMALIEEVLSAAANLYSWPKFQSETKNWRAPTETENETFAGTYLWRNQKTELTFTVTAKDDHFIISSPDALKPTAFFIEKDKQGPLHLFSQIGMTLTLNSDAGGAPVMAVWGSEAHKQ